MASNRVNVPQYVSNVKKSVAYTAGNVLRSHMPSLVNVVTTNSEATKQLTRFMRENKNNVNSSMKSSIYNPIKNVLSNFKEDFKSGKFYNPDRENEAMESSLRDMIGDDFFNDTSMDMQETEQDPTSSAINKMISTTELGQKSRTKALVDTISESSAKSMEYLGGIGMMNHNQSMILNSKNHSEHMAAMNNLQNIGMALLDFNTVTIANHIKQTSKYFDESITELREIKALLKETTEIQRNKYNGIGPTNRNRRGTNNTLENIMDSNGAPNIKEYLKAIKGNVNSQLPIGADMLGMFAKSAAASPWSMIGGLLSSSLLPKSVKVAMGDLDKSISGLFSSFILQMNKLSKSGNSKLNILGKILGIDMQSNTRPNLAMYKTEGITADVEAKKAKAITEVIPEYLSKLVALQTGQEMIYNYSTGRFVSRSTERKNYDKRLKGDNHSSMSGTKSEMQRNIAALNLGKDNATMDDDLKTFLGFLGTSGVGYNPNKDSYQSLVKMGLKLKGGQKSYQVLKAAFLSMPKAVQNRVSYEQVSNVNSLRRNMNTFNRDLMDTGMSSLYNGFDLDYSGLQREIISGQKSSKKFTKSGSSKKTKDKYYKNSNAVDIDLNTVTDPNVIMEIMKARRDSTVLVNPNADKEKMPFDDVADKLLKKGKGLKERLFSYLENPSNVVADVLNGVNEGIYQLLYGKTGEKIFPKDIQSALAKYLPKAKTGGIIGGVAGLMAGNPLLGAIAGASINMLASTDKFSKYLWGEEDKDGKRKGGLLSDFRNIMKEKILDPMKKFMDDRIWGPLRKWFDKTTDGALKWFKSIFSPGSDEETTEGENANTPAVEVSGPEKQDGNKRKLRIANKTSDGKVASIIPKNDMTIDKVTGQIFRQTATINNKYTSMNYSDNLSAIESLIRDTLNVNKTNLELIASETSTIRALVAGNIGGSGMIDDINSMGDISSKGSVSKKGFLSKIGGKIGSLFSGLGKMAGGAAKGAGSLAGGTLQGIGGLVKAAAGNGTIVRGTVGGILGSMLGLPPSVGFLLGNILGSEKGRGMAGSVLSGTGKAVGGVLHGLGGLFGGAAKGAGTAAKGAGGLAGGILKGIFGMFGKTGSKSDSGNDSDNGGSFLQNILGGFKGGLGRMMLGGLAAGAFGINPLLGIAASAFLGKGKKGKSGGLGGGLFKNKDIVTVRVEGGYLDSISGGGQSFKKIGPRLFKNWKKMKNGQVDEVMEDISKQASSISSQSDIDAHNLQVQQVQAFNDGTGSGVGSSDKKKGIFGKAFDWIKGMLGGALLRGGLGSALGIGLSKAYALGPAAELVHGIATGDSGKITRSVWDGTRVYGSKALSGLMGFGKNSADDIAKTLVTRGGKSIGTATVRGAAKNSGLLAKFGGWISKFLRADKLKPIFGKLGGKMSKHTPKIVQAILNGLKNNIDNFAAKITTSIAKWSNPVGWAMIIVQATYDITSGMADASNIFRLAPGTDVSFGMRLSSGLAKALSNFFTFGFLSIPWLAQFLYNLFADDEEKLRVQESQEKLRGEYNKFTWDNPDSNISFDKYNELRNQTTWGKIKGVFGGGKTLDDYKNSAQVTIENNTYAQQNIASDPSEGGRGKKDIFSVFSKIPMLKYGMKMTGADKKKGIISRTWDRLMNSQYAPWNRAFNNKNKEKDNSGGRGYDGYEYYNQNDPRWGNNSFGIYNNSRDTVGAGGCGPTAAAMVMQKLTGRKITPDETASYAVNSGFKQINGGTHPGYFNSIGEQYGVDFQQSTPTSPSTISALKNNMPVIMMGQGNSSNTPFGNSSHYVVATGMDGTGNVKILDPLNRSNNKKYPLKNILKNSTRAIIGRSGGRGYMDEHGFKVTSIFGKSATRDSHHGIDLGLPEGTPFTSFTPGVVTDVGFDKIYGNYVKIGDSNGHTHLYGHFTKANVKVGDVVTTSTIVGFVGTTGKSTGPHVHYEVRKKSSDVYSAVNPEAYLTNNASKLSISVPAQGSTNYNNSDNSGLLSSDLSVLFSSIGSIMNPLDFSSISSLFSSKPLDDTSVPAYTESKDTAGLNLTGMEFIKMIAPAAINNYHKYGILPSITLAQVAQESGWGKSAIGNNILGIKAGSGWKGKTQWAPTYEYENGKYVKKMLEFRDYDSISDCLEDHGKILYNNKKIYSNFWGKDNYKDMAHALTGVYATDKEYGQKLINIIDYNKFTDYDKQVGRGRSNPMETGRGGSLIGSPSVPANYLSGVSTPSPRKTLGGIITTLSNKKANTARGIVGDIVKANPTSSINVTSNDGPILNVLYHIAETLEQIAQTNQVIASNPGIGTQLISPGTNSILNDGTGNNRIKSNLMANIAAGT